MRKKILISLISLILASGFFVSGALAEDKTILAVVDFAFSNVEIEGSKAITDTFRQELAKNKALQILSHDTVEAVFDKVDPMLKLKLSQSDCTDVSCGVRVGRDLGAQATILGTINKQENRYTVAAKLVNLEKRDVEFIVSQDCNSVKELSDATKQLAAKVLSSLPQPGETPEQTKQRRLALEKKEQETEKKEQEAKQKELAQRNPGTCPE